MCIKCDQDYTNWLDNEVRKITVIPIGITPFRIVSLYHEGFTAKEIANIVPISGDIHNPLRFIERVIERIA